MCCKVAPGVEAICAVWRHQEWKQCAVRWHQEWKQYVLYGGTRSGSNVCCKVTPGVEAICAIWRH